MTDIGCWNNGLDMEIIEQRIRDAVATLLSRGAKALERTAGELEQAAGELRRHASEDEPERAWSEPARETDTITRSAPLRAVPDTPTDASVSRRVPPVKPPQAPGVDTDGHVTADAGPSPVADPGLLDARDDAARPPSDAGAAPPGDGAGPADVVSTGDAEDTGEVATAERLRTLATGTVSEIRAQLDDLSASELRTLRGIEVGNRNRITLLTAIDRALDADD